MTQFNVHIPGTTCLHILLAYPCLYYYLLRPHYTVLHILFHCTLYPLFFFLFLFYSYLDLYIYILLCYVSLFLFIYLFFHCPLSGPDLHFTTDYYTCISCMHVQIINCT